MMQEPIGERLKVISTTNPDRRFTVLRRVDGLFFHVEERFWHPAEEDEGIELGWQAENESGLFASVEAAETAARSSMANVR